MNLTNFKLSRRTQIDSDNNQNSIKPTKLMNEFKFKPPSVRNLHYYFIRNTSLVSLDFVYFKVYIWLFRDLNKLLNESYDNNILKNLEI